MNFDPRIITWLHADLVWFFVGLVIAIAVRDVVLSPTPAERDKEIATIGALADFYAQSAAPLEKLITRPGAAPELGQLYAEIRSAESRAAASTMESSSLVVKGLVR